jgi:hypothetical protein
MNSAIASMLTSTMTFSLIICLTPCGGSIWLTQHRSRKCQYGTAEIFE